MLEFLRSLYKENVDSLLYAKYIGTETEPLEVVERATTAKMCNMLFNLPEVLKNLEESFEKQKAQKEKFAKAQESGAIQMLGKRQKGE